MKVTASGVRIPYALKPHVSGAFAASVRPLAGVSQDIVLFSSKKAKPPRKTLVDYGIPLAELPAAIVREQAALMADRRGGWRLPIAKGEKTPNFQSVAGQEWESANIARDYLTRALHLTDEPQYVFDMGHDLAKADRIERRLALINFFRALPKIDSGLRKLQNEMPTKRRLIGKWQRERHQAKAETWEALKDSILEVSVAVKGRHLPYALPQGDLHFPDWLPRFTAVAVCIGQRIGVFTPALTQDHHTLRGLNRAYQKSNNVQELAEAEIRELQEFLTTLDPTDTDSQKAVEVKLDAHRHKLERINQQMESIRTVYQQRVDEYQKDPKNALGALQTINKTAHLVGPPSDEVLQQRIEDHFIAQARLITPGVKLNDPSDPDFHLQMHFQVHEPLIRYVHDRLIAGAEYMLDADPDEVKRKLDLAGYNDPSMVHGMKNILEAQKPPQVMSLDAFQLYIDYYRQVKTAFFYGQTPPVFSEFVDQMLPALKP